MFNIISLFERSFNTEGVSAIGTSTLAAILIPILKADDLNKRST